MKNFQFVSRLWLVLVLVGSMFFANDVFSQETVKLTFGQSLKPTKYDYVSFGLAALDGVARGMENAFHKNHRIFEQRFGADEFGFFGSQGWQRNYANNRYFASDGTFNKHKSEVLGNFGRDLKHTADDVSKWSGRFAGGTFALGACIDLHGKKKNKWAVISKGVLIWLTSSFIERTTYEFITR